MSTLFVLLNNIFLQVHRESIYIPNSSHGYRYPEKFLFKDENVNSLFSRLAQHGLRIELEIFQRTPDSDNARAIYEALDTCVQQLNITIPAPDSTNNLESRGWFRLWGKKSRAGARQYEFEKLDILNDDPYKYSTLMKAGRAVQAAVASAKPALIFGAILLIYCYPSLTNVSIAPIAGPVIWDGHVCCAPNIMGSETIRVDDDNDVRFDVCLPECDRTRPRPVPPYNWHTNRPLALPPGRSLFDGLDMFTSTSHSHQSLDIPSSSAVATSQPPAVVCTPAAQTIFIPDDEDDEDDGEYQLVLAASRATYEACI